MSTVKGVSKYMGKKSVKNKRKTSKNKKYRRIEKTEIIKKLQLKPNAST
jgi:hypothetical protein